jgi:hypothetical protein
MTRKVKDIDKGWKRIKKDLKELDHSHTKIGIQQKSDTGNRSLSDMVTIGAVHEFGAPRKNVPMRSFMRTTLDEQRRNIASLQTKVHSSVVSGRISVRTGLAIIGEFVTTKIKKKITDIKFPPLKNPSRKRTGGGIANPLVDTGQLRASITHVEVIK